MTDRKTLIFVLALFLLTGKAVQSQEMPRFIITEPIEKRIIEEEVHSFKEQKYDPPAEIELISVQDKASYKIPEDALVAFLSAVLKGDLKWKLELLTNAERSKFEKLDADKQVSEIETAKRQAEQLWKGKKIVLERKITVGELFVIIEFATYEKENDKRVFGWPASFAMEQGKWKTSGGGAVPGHPLYHILRNFNYKFSEKEKRLKETGIYTAKPYISSSMLKKKERVVGSDN